MQSYYDSLSPSSTPLKTHRRLVSRECRASATIQSGSTGQWGAEEVEDGAHRVRVPKGLPPSFGAGLIRISYEVKVIFYVLESDGTEGS